MLLINAIYSSITPFNIFSYRHYLEVGSDEFTFENPEFVSRLETVLEKVKTKVGCQTSDIQLHKLVICGEGAPIESLGNSKKEDTFGSLIVQLPSLFTRGSLHIQHGNERKTFEFDGPEAQYGIIYAAHFSNCNFQMTPVESGFRTLLVYDLISKDARSYLERFNESIAMKRKISVILSEVSFPFRFIISTTRK